MPRLFPKRARKAPAVAIGGTPFRVAKGMQVLVGRPATPPPTKLVEALMDAAERDSRIESLYLYLAKLPRETPHLVTGLEFVPNRASEGKLAAISSIGATMRPHFKPMRCTT